MGRNVNIRLQRQALEENKAFKALFPKFEGQDRDKLCPFVIYAGATNNTEYGEIGLNTNPADFQQFQRIFSGEDSVLAIWEGSTKAEKLLDTDTFLTKSYKVGKVLEAYKTTHITSNSFTTDEIGNVKQATDETISFILEGQAPTASDMFKLWNIPSLSKKLFYISSANIWTSPDNPNEVIFSEIVLNSVDDIIAAAGAKVNSFIQYGGWGEGYAFPKWNSTTKKVELDADRLKNIPITNLQLELFGSNTLTAFYAIGRPTKTNDNKIVAPRLLFGYKLKQGVASKLNKFGTGEANFYVFSNANVEVEAQFSNWKEKVLTSINNRTRANYEGALKTDFVNTQASNAFTPQKQINNVNWDIPITSTEYECSGNEFIKGSYTIPSTAKAHDLLGIHSLVFKDTLKLPISLKTTTSWQLKDIPIIGGFLNIITFGLPIGWKDSEYVLQGKPLFGFISTILYDTTAGLQLDSSQQGYIAMDTFRNGTDDTTGALMGNNNTSSIFNILLTHKINVADEEIDTMDLGQITGTNADGSNIYKLLNSAGNNKAIDPILAVDEGYIIDAVIFFGTFKGNVKITGASYGNSVAQLEIMTRAKFTDNIREWANIIRLSNWDEEAGKIIDYPAAIIPPSPPTQINNPMPYIEVPINITAFDFDEALNEVELTFDLANYLQGTTLDWSGYERLEFNMYSQQTAATGNESGGFCAVNESAVFNSPVNLSAREFDTIGGAKDIGGSSLSLADICMCGTNNCGTFTADGITKLERTGETTFKAIAKVSFNVIGGSSIDTQAIFYKVKFIPFGY